MIPTPFLRWVRRDTEGPSRVLQCWHVYLFEDMKRIIKGEVFPDNHFHHGHLGKWIDVPIIEPIDDVRITKDKVVFDEQLWTAPLRPMANPTWTGHHRGYPANPLVKR